MEAYGKCVTGMVRKNNEDTIYLNHNSIGTLPNLYVVADGMGGHMAGEVASRLAVSSFCGYIARETDNWAGKKGDNLLEALKQAVQYANDSILKEASKHPEMAGMGTTLLTVSVAADGVYITNVGDCRLYHIDNGITQITNDHSYVMELVRQGKLTEEQASRHPNKNILTRALGVNENFEVDAHFLPLPLAGYLLMCSDGLTNMLTNDEIYHIVMQKDNNCSQKVDSLVDEANRKGGNDNISVIMINVGKEVSYAAQ